MKNPIVSYLRVIVAVTLILTGTGMTFIPTTSDTRVTVGSPVTPFSQNKQNEPAIAVDANHPNVLVAGANDNIDMEACNAGDDTTCPFTDGVGVSGIYFSFNGGATWTQPTYTGWTARHCLGAPGPDADCAPHVGPIGTLPLYFENGLVSDGDPAVAFGPVPDAQGHFAWANGSRLYYANLVSNFSAVRSETAFKGFEAIGVSRTDNLQAAAAGSNFAWKPPVLVSKQSSTTFTDKEQVWADNAETSPYFGNVYVCWADFRSNSHGRGFPTPLEVATSTDGGDTWTERQASPATDNGINSQPDGCTVRTDSHGVVYVFGIATRNGVSYETLTRSFDGGKHWSKLQLITSVGDVGVFDPVIGRPTEDGVAGARNDLATGASADIANGAPTGADATDEIVMTYTDGIDGLNHEHARITWSTDGGNNWSTPASIEQAGDRSFYVAPAISPNGTDVYVVYNAWLAPYQTTTANPRPLVGVVRHADVAGNGGLGSWTTLHRGAPGDARGSSQNNLVAEFLGDYVYAVATRTYGAAVWNDVRNAADCPAIDAWRQSLETGGSVPRPAPQQDCPGTFGNSDIFGGSFPDPTP
jgi:hypothetical protein